MARKSSRRRFNLRRVRVAAGFAIGALSPLDVGELSITNAVTDPLRIISANLTYKISDLGAAIDDGFEIGLAHGDYSATEIEECLEAQASIDRNDKIALEQANRLVRSIGQMEGDAVAGGGLTLNSGMPVKTKLNWYIGSGQTLALWVRNGSGVVWTTGANAIVQGDIWVKDSV